VCSVVEPIPSLFGDTEIPEFGSEGL